MITHDRVAELVGRPDATILEIGANDGRDSLELIEHFPAGRIFAFEPDPRAIQRFKRHVKHPRVHLVETAVGQIDGAILFNQSGGRPPVSIEEQRLHGWPDDWDLSGSIRRPHRHLILHPWCTFDTQIEVNVVRLDTWIQDNGIHEIDFIWADVQGAEADLILGGLNALSQTRYFYTEYSENGLYDGSLGLQDIQRLLPEFALEDVFTNDALFRRVM